MIQVIYGDILLLIDFCIDFFVLFTTGIFLRKKTKTFCLAGAALFGAIYSVAKVFINGNDIIDFFITVSVGLLMCYISFGGYKFIKTAMVFFSISATVAGLMMAIYFFLGSYHYDIFGNMRGYAYSHIPLWLFALLATLSFFISWIFSYVGRERFEKQEITVKIQRNNKNVTLRLLLDTGNLVKEPISGKNVIIVNAFTVKPLFSIEEFGAIMSGDCEFLLKRSFRMVSIYGIEGERKMQFAFMPDKLTVFCENSENECDAYIAVCGKSCFFEKTDGIANPSIIT